MKMPYSKQRYGVSEKQVTLYVLEILRREEVQMIMGLDLSYPENSLQIIENSFYDVFYDYSAEELEEYKYMAGITEDDTY